MRHAVWKIDFQNQSISITEDRDNFEINHAWTELSFKPSLTGSPYIKVNLEGFERKLLLDLGMRRTIEISEKVLAKIDDRDYEDFSINGHGNLSAGLAGYGSPSNEIFAKVENLHLGELSLSDFWITFVEEGDSEKLGLGLLMQFECILDWNTNHLFLKPNSDFEVFSLFSYGFKPIFLQEGEVIMGYVFLESPAYEVGLSYGDKVLRIDSLDCQSIKREEWCQWLTSFERGEYKRIAVTIEKGASDTTYYLDRSWMDHFEKGDLN